MTVTCKLTLQQLLPSKLKTPILVALSAALITLSGCSNLTPLSQSHPQPTTTMSEQMSAPNPTESAAPHATKNMTDYVSPYDFATTSSRVQAVIEKSPAKLFATVPHSQGAQKVGMTLNPTTLFIFGNPKVGTPVLQANQKLAMELPIKILVWQDDAGKVYVSQQDFVKLANDYHVDPNQLAPLDKAVKTIIQAALK